LKSKKVRAERKKPKEKENKESCSDKTKCRPGQKKARTHVQLKAIQKRREPTFPGFRTKKQKRGEKESRRPKKKDKTGSADLSRRGRKERQPPGDRRGEPQHTNRKKVIFGREEAEIQRKEGPVPLEKLAGCGEGEQPTRLILDRKKQGRGHGKLGKRKGETDSRRPGDQKKRGNIL